MAGKLSREIKQSRPFASVEQEVFLNVLRTADVLGRWLEEVLKAGAVSAVQYNVLRILRGAGAEGLACGEVGDRMITRDPDITRLLDRLEKRMLIARRREKSDRRVIRATITDEGRKLLAGLDPAIARMLRDRLGHLGAAKLRTMSDLLEEAREGTV